MKCLYLIVGLWYVNLAIAVTRPRSAKYRLRLPRPGPEDKGFNNVIVRRTVGKPKLTGKESSSVSRARKSRQRERSPNAATQLFNAPPVGDTESDERWGQARAALLYATAQKDPPFRSPSPRRAPNPERGLSPDRHLDPRRSPSPDRNPSPRRSSSPPMAGVSGHPLSAMAIARGPATVETDADDFPPKKKYDVPKGKHHFVNLQSKGGIAAGAHVFEGGAITVATTGQITAGTIDARRGGHGYLINQRDHGEYHHDVPKGTKFERAIHSMNKKTTNVGSIATLEGKGALNAGAVESIERGTGEEKPYDKYGWET